ncbi:GPI transamidase component PIG-T [Nematostella vectensis]|uniref:GPI transamidase component PIG-T n=1 Tax=Nematostella vectensis TaxID=45351 RepID=UPI002077020A|nr:GPI transamidase component PIG-T [Nematostella vectensis]
MAASVEVLVAVTLYLVFMSSICDAAKETFHEELLIKPLHTGHVYAYFQFTTEWDVRVSDRQAFSHYGLFPKSFGQIVDKYSVNELHFSLTQGQWQQGQWGYPLVSAPPGAELWVWFQEKVIGRVDENWSGLTQAMSGQFCASLNFIDKKTSSTPQQSFRPEGVATANDPTLLRYAALGREGVCTENLTPWKKLLPCDSKAGLSTLLNGLMVYTTNYHSMAIHLRPVCKDSACTSYSLELQQTLSIVIDPVLRSKRKDWSFRKLFGRAIKSSCPLATTSLVLVDLTINETGSRFSLKPPPTKILNRQLSPDLKYGVYDVRELVNSKSEGNIVFKWQQQPAKEELPQFYAHRFLTGFGEEKGGITTLLYNNHASKPLSVVYFATYPWFLRMFLHTLRIESNGKAVKPGNLFFVPAQDRQRPYTLELELTLPPNSVTRLTIQFNRGFLKWTEHPPDAHHGFYITSAVITAQLDTPFPCRNNRTFVLSREISGKNPGPGFVRLHTESLLVTLPTPDFSMPYNVICLACTVLAIAFGSYHNLCTRRFEQVSNKTLAAQGMMGKVRSFLRRVKERFFGKKGQETIAKTGKGTLAEKEDKTTAGQEENTEHAQSDKKE